jgi:hypothetical protein
MAATEGQAMKIAICVPHYGDVKADFARSLANLVSRTVGTSVSEGQPGPLVKVFTSEGRIISNRSALVRLAREWAADYILWADTDHIFPTDALIRLLRHRLPVVGCNYARRRRPTFPTACHILTDGTVEPIWTTPEDAQAGKVEKVSLLGLGFCLVDTSVLSGLEGSLFQLSLDDRGEGLIGEDAYFCSRLRDAGVEIWLDHALSWEIGHIWQDVRYLSDALAEKDALNAERLQKGRSYVGSIYAPSKFAD